MFILAVAIFPTGEARDDVATRGDCAIRGRLGLCCGDACIAAQAAPSALANPEQEQLKAQFTSRRFLFHFFVWLDFELAFGFFGH
jgi:hypothetical protein